MKNTITEALIYENQGLKDDALEVYKNILKSDAGNKEAAAAIRRLGGVKLKKQKDLAMVDFFLNLKNDEEIREFKRWLVKI